MATYAPFFKSCSLYLIFGIVAFIFMETRDIKYLILRDMSPNMLETNQHQCHCNAQNTGYKSNVRDLRDPNVRRMRRLPQVIIIGVMKCGTYALDTMMEIHSKIVTTSIKTETEVDFFNLNYGRGLNWYKSQMPYSWQDQITVEKSPKYTQIESNIVPQRMHSMNSSLRMILVVKDPVTRTISHYAHNDDKGRYPQSFEQTVLRPNGEVNAKHPIIRYSLYETYLNYYLEVFSRKQILVVDGDQLVTNPVPILQKVERFLDLEPEITDFNFYYNEQRGFYCLKKNNVRGCLKKNKGREHPEVDEDVIKKLRDYFTPYNKRFYELVGHDFGWETE